MISGFRGKYRFLSNFYDWGGCCTAEHHYQAAKATNERDADWVRNAKTPAEAKKRGRQIPVRSDWDEVKLQVMEDVVREKFQDKILQGLLLETGDQELVEDNWWGDTFWGTCKGTGENHLGKILMKIRKEIRDELE